MNGRRWFAVGCILGCVSWCTPISLCLATIGVCLLIMIGPAK